eukprot:6737425-Heterocapsa_arctica.AAC.1
MGSAYYRALRQDYGRCEPGKMGMVPMNPDEKVCDEFKAALVAMQCTPFKSGKLMEWCKTGDALNQ